MGVTNSKTDDYAQNDSNPSKKIIDDIISRFLDDKFTISRSFQTRLAYSKGINKFLEFLTKRYNLDLMRFLSQVKETKQIDPIESLAEYRVFLTKYPRKGGKNGYSNITIRSYFSVAKELLNRQGCKIYQEDLRQRITPLKITRTYEKGLTREIINRILRLAHPKLAAAILMACSGGFRLGEIVQLRLSDVDFRKNPTEVTIRAATTKTRQTRITCISSEATTALNDFISKSLEKEKNPGKEKYIFLKHHEERISELKNKIVQKKSAGQQINFWNKVLQNWESELKKLGSDERYSKDVRVAINSLESQLLRIISAIPDLNEKNENGNNLIHFHAFRKFFKTQVTDAHQSDFAEALMGHSSIKLLYYIQNDKARSETYRQIEHAVTIADTEKFDQNIVEMQEDYQDLRKVIDSLSRQLKNIEKRIEVKSR